ncbi:MAG: GNAT family N-acetyltransferase [Cyclobacteriaceae bacterium]
MEAYISHEGSLPSGFGLDFEPALFNTPAFAGLQQSAGIVSFYLLDQGKKKAIACIYFHVSDQIARSPLKAPFGSIECSKKINPNRLYTFLEYVEAQLKQKGVGEVYIKNPPRAYSPEMFSLVETFFVNHKYHVTDAEVSTVIPVTQEPFAARIRNSEKLRMRQAQKAAFTFQDLPMAKLGDVYGFISRCHHEKGYQLSITFDDLQRTVNEFPEQYLLFVVLQQSVIIAASISIRIKKNTLYNFVANHEKQYNRLSPPVILMEGMYEYCRQNKITLFDLGTSALKGKPNFPLLDFKLHIGGLPTSKLSFYKKLS